VTALLTKLTQLPNDIRTAEDYLAYAQSRVTADVWRYLQEGSGKDLTLKANMSAFESLHLTPRPLAVLKNANTQLHLFGQHYAHPFLLAPIAYQRLFHQDGELATAMAANAQSGQMIVSSLASQPLEKMIEVAEQPLWFQLYWQGDRARTLRLVNRAISAGYNVVMFTIDAPVKQAILRLPADIQAVNQEAPLQARALEAQQSMVFDGWMAQAPTWDDLAWLRDQIQVPLVVKGILHPKDAEHVVALGCEGLVVSNHGGRVMDGTPTSLAVLPSIVNVLSGKTKVLFDSGIRTGQDAYKAIALGADAVLLGRPYVWGLASAGAVGVAHVLRLLRDELEMTMALTGVRDLSSIQKHD
jgi:4-hydroxymandelate oxidase